MVSLHQRLRCVLAAPVLLIIVALCGCGSSADSNPKSVNGPADSDSLTSVSVQLNWYPEAEHGGVYQALADGTYEAAGLDVQIRPGGRSTPVAPELDLGRCQFAVTNADDVVQFRKEGSKVVAVLAALQNHPRCILVRKDSGVNKFEQLPGMTLQCQAGRGFLEFMRMKGYLDQVQQVPYHGSISSMIADPKIAIQAYCFAEPLLANQQDVATNQLMVSDLGWNPYSSVLVTTDSVVEESPEMVRKFVAATQIGWQNYFDDPTKGNAAILAANKYGMTAEALEFGVQQMKGLAKNDGDAPVPLGTMTEQRWSTLVNQIDQFDKDRAGRVDAADCFTSEFLPTSP